MRPEISSTQICLIHTVLHRQLAQRLDCLAVEEPLEIRLIYGNETGWEHKPIAVIMRTPGHDCALAAGFLFTEGLLHDPQEIDEIEYCRNAQPEHQQNIIHVRLKAGTTFKFEPNLRNFYSTSSCGICGKASLEALEFQAEPIKQTALKIRYSAIQALPLLLREQQANFSSTGALHAAGLFDANNELLDVYEDVGRHNALDKLIGERFLRGALPVQDHILMLSGRASFELLQKALMAGISLVASVGAPSSLAVELARKFNITLCGFVRDDRFNIYSAAERLIPDNAQI